MKKFYLYGLVVAVLLVAGCETTPVVEATANDDGSTSVSFTSEGDLFSGPITGGITIPPPDLPVDEPWWPWIAAIAGSILVGNQTKRIPIEKSKAIIGG